MSLFVIVILNIVTLLLINYYSLYITISLSNSMYPTIKKGNILIVKGRVNFNRIKLNDIVVYKVLNIQYPIMHRVIKVLDDRVITKGDNNQKEDDFIVNEENIIGKLIYRFKTNIDIIDIRSKTMLYNILLYTIILLLEWFVYGIIILTNLL